MADVRADDVSIALAFAWKFRCAVIKPTSSVVKSTLDRSRAPARIVPKPAVPASPNAAAPDFADDKYELSPFWRRPSLLANVVSTIFPRDSYDPLE